MTAALGLLILLLILLLLLLLLSSCMAHMHTDNPCTGCTHRPMCMLAHTRTLALMHGQDRVVQDAHVHDSACTGHTCAQQGCTALYVWRCMLALVQNMAVQDMCVAPRP